MEDHKPLDEIDLRILDVIQSNPPLSTADLAEKVGLSQSPSWRRLTQLKQAGYVHEAVIRLNAQKLGFGLMVFANVKLNAHGRANLNEFSEALQRFPEVQEAHAIMGAFDFLLRIVARDVESYRQFVYGKLATLPSVLEISSTIAMAEIKSHALLPIRAP